MGKVVHFELPVDDGDRAVSFYRRVFGWGAERWGAMDYWSTAAGDGPGIDGGLTARYPESRGPMVYIQVDDVDAALAEVEAAGGQRLSERRPIPGVGWMAAFEDTEGNRVGVFQEDTSAPVPS
jgi:uncharacterized protein